MQTNGVPPSGGIAHWHATVCANYVRAETRALGQQCFNGSLEARRFGPVVLSHIRSTPIEYEHIEAGGDGQPFFITLTLCPEAFLIQDKRQSRQETGDIVIFDSAKPYLCQFPRGDDQLVLMVDRDTMLRHIPKAPLLSSLTLKATSPIGALSRTLFREAWNAGALEKEAGERISKALLDIIGTGFDTDYAQLTQRESSHRLRQLNRVKRYILEHLDAPNLSIGTIARDNFISPRTLNRLFASEGTTAHRWLWDQRIAACRDALLRGGAKHVSEIALAMGYKSLSHFSRAFRQAYGVSPRQMLNPYSQTTD